jgi:hypothetical protein
LSCSSAAPDYGIDLTLHGIAIIDGRRCESGHKLDLQAKCTTLATDDSTHVRYDLAVSNYESLRLAWAGCPRILVVLVLPRDEDKWFGQTEEALVLRRCAYWLSLKGRPATGNRRSVRLMIPRSNVFSVEALRGLMERIRTGGEP